jgi:hypothetical protein
VSVCAGKNFGVYSGYFSIGYEINQFSNEDSFAGHQIPGVTYY